METIPQKVRALANEWGCNQIVLLGTYEEGEAYSIGLVDDEGFVVPTGLPTIIVLKDGKTKVVCGEEGLELLGRFI